MKLKAKCDSYGFLGKYHYKGDIVEVEEGTKFPEHFEILEDVKAEEKNEEKKKEKKHK